MAPSRTNNYCRELTSSMEATGKQRFSISLSALDDTDESLSNFDDLVTAPTQLAALLAARTSATGQFRTFVLSSQLPSVEKRWSDSVRSETSHGHRMPACGQLKRCRLPQTPFHIRSSREGSLGGKGAKTQLGHNLNRDKTTYDLVAGSIVRK